MEEHAVVWKNAVSVRSDVSSVSAAVPPVPLCGPPSLSNMESEASSVKDPLNESIDEQQQDEEKLDWKSRLFKYTNIMLPHVVITVVLLVYLTIGALILTFLEDPYERAVRRAKIQALLNKYDTIINDTWQLVVDRKVADELDWHRILKSKLIELGEIHDKQFRQHIQLYPHSKSKWTFPTSLLNALTLLSACGYNEVAVYTAPGQIFSFIYTLVGIPLMFVTAANIGMFLSETLLHTMELMELMQHRWSRYRRRRQAQQRRESAALAAKISKASLFMPQPAAAATARLSDDSTAESTAWNGELFTSNAYAAEPEQHNESLEDMLQRQAMIDDEEDDEAPPQPTNHLKTLWFPILIYISGISAYCCLGTLMFRTWEEDWSFVHAFHFGFNLIVTVGLGDVVVTDAMFLVLLITFVIVGLAVVTMCVDLASSHLKEYFMKIHMYGRKQKYRRLDKDLTNMVEFLMYMRVKRGGKVTWREVRDLMESVRRGAYNPREAQYWDWMDYALDLFERNKRLATQMLRDPKPDTTPGSWSTMSPTVGLGHATALLASPIILADDDNDDENDARQRAAAPPPPPHFIPHRSHFDRRASHDGLLTEDTPYPYRGREQENRYGTYRHVMRGVQHKTIRETSPSEDDSESDSDRTQPSECS